MNMKKLICTILALALTLCAAALAETDDLQAQLDAANARIEELEAEVEKYRPVYESQIVATFGEDGIIWREDAMKEYESAASAYSQYGLSIDDYADEVKQQILETLVTEAVKAAKIAELGLDQMDEETRKSIEEEAAKTFETYVDQYKSYFADENASDEDARAQTLAALEQYGLTQEALTQQMLDNHADELLYNEVTKDVTVSDEEIQAKYEALVAQDQESYTSDYSYNSARNDEETVIAWNPEGYRAVKHVLIKFGDEQASQYSDLQNRLHTLNSELEALDKPAEESGEETAEAPEETPVPRTREEIQAEISEVAAQSEALYSELLPKAQEVIEKFNAGTDFDSLIAEYNEDPGMTQEPTATNGYAVSADSTTWDPAFTEGAMSIEAVGQISEPVYGQYGIHIIYYMADIPAGPVPFEDIADAVKATAQEEKVSQTYDDQISAWVAEANPQYFADRF